MFIPKPGDQLPTLAVKSRRALESEARSNGRRLELCDRTAVAGCPRDLDDRAWKTVVPHTARAPRRRLMFFGQHQAQLNHLSAFDHLRTMARSLGSDGVLAAVSPITLSRAACEAAVRVGWLLDTTVSYDERITRSAGFLYCSACNELKAAKEMLPGPERDKAVAEAQELLNKLKVWLGKAEIYCMLDSKGKDVATLQIPAAGVKVAVKWEIGPKMKTMLPEVPSWYTRSSGTAHGATWTLRQVVSPDSSSPNVKWQPDLVGIAEATVAAIHASALIVRSYALYFGLDPEPLMRESRSRAGIIEAWKANWIGLQEQEQQLKRALTLARSGGRSS